MKIIEDDITIVLFVIFCSMIMGIFGFCFGRVSMRQEAVDNNVARWTVDNRCHTGFEWIKQ